MSKHHSSCSNCSGCASSQGSCCGGSGGGTLLLCEEELTLLSDLAQYAFLPIVQYSEEGQPHYGPAWENPPFAAPLFTSVVSSLESKRLIVLDPDLPLSGTDYHSFLHLPDIQCGSIAFTCQGQEVADWLVFKDYSL